MTTADITDFQLYDADNDWPYERVEARILPALDYGVDFLPLSGGSKGNVPVSFLDAEQAAGLAGHYLYDFYYRIWVFPSTFVVNNPSLLVDQPFGIWNAYPNPATNTLESITFSGSTGLTISASEGDIYRALEYRTVNLQVTGSAPLNIQTEFNFIFEEGEGHMLFASIRSVILRIEPEVPVVETWAWLSDIMVSYDGTEQRTSLRDRGPRRTLKIDIPIDGNASYREHFQDLWTNIAAGTVFPYYQYATENTIAAPSGDTTVYLNPARSDFRETENVLIAAPAGFHVAKITTLETDHIILDAPFPFDLPLGQALVMPCAEGFVANESKLDMQAWESGVLTLEGRISTVRDSLLRPGSETTFALMGPYIILDKRPISPDTTDTTFDGGAELIDYNPAILKLISSWTIPKIQFNRQYLVQRQWHPEDMDWWRDFLHYQMGRLVPFFAPTWRSDLELAEAPSPTASQIKTTGNFYSNTLYPSNPALRYITIQSPGGVHHAEVTSVFNNGDGTDTITFIPHLPVDDGWTDITCISFLIKCRLANDVVTLTHSALHTIFELSFRSIP